MFYLLVSVAFQKAWKKIIDLHVEITVKLISSIVNYTHVNVKYAHLFVIQYHQDLLEQSTIRPPCIILLIYESECCYTKPLIVPVR